MKNTKFTKIALLILSVALLVGAAFAVSTSATETPTEEEILSDMKVNLKYGDMLYFLCLVDAENLGPDADVRFTLYKDADCTDVAATVKAEYLEEGDVKLGTKPVYNTGYYADFATHGVSATFMGVDYYVKATIVKADGNVEGEAVKCSVIKYLLERLYEDNPSDLQREHYENTIAYGSTAQKVTKDEKTNIADFLWVAAENGTVNGAASAVVTKDTALNFAYTGVEDPSGLAYWLDPNGNKTTVATSSGIYAPKFANFTFGDLSNDTVVTLSTSSGFKVASLADGDKDVSKYAGLIYSIPPSTGRDQSFSIVDGALKHTSTTGGVEFGLYNAKNYEANFNYTNFESDVKMVVPEGKTKMVITTQFRLNTSYERYRVILTYDTNGYFYIKFQIRNYWGSGYHTLSDTAVRVAENGSQTAEFNLRFESVYIADTDDSALAVYVNGVAIMIADSRAYTAGYDAVPTSKDDLKPYKNSEGTYICKFGHMSPSVSDASLQEGVYRMIYFNPNGGYPGDICFDNIIFESKALSADEIPVYDITPKS